MGNSYSNSRRRDVEVRVQRDACMRGGGHVREPRPDDNELVNDEAEEVEVFNRNLGSRMIWTSYILQLYNLLHNKSTTS